MFLIAPMISTLFILLFCQQFVLEKRRRIYILPVILITIYAILLAVNNSLITIELSDAGINSIYPNKLFYLFYGLYFTIYFQLSINTLKKHQPGKDPLKYSQAQNLVYGTGLTGTPGIITNIALPAFGVTQLVWMGPIFSLVFLSFSTVAITRYKLFDIKATIVRSTGYLFAIALLAAVYALIFVGGLSNTFLSDSVVTGYGWVGISVVTIFVAISFNPLKVFFDKLTSKLFYRDAYNTQEVLDEIGKIIVGSIDLHKIEKSSLAVLNNALKSAFIGFVLKSDSSIDTQDFLGSQPDFDEDSLRKSLQSVGKKELVYDEIQQASSEKAATLRKNDISLIVPLITKSETIGYLVSGPKKSGNIFNQQDRSMLNIVANELAVALQNAQRFEEIQAFNITLQEKVDEATKELKKTNKKLVELDEAKDEFISMASHQLRTPLTSIKGYLSMLMEGDLGKVSKQQDQALKEAFTSSQRMVFLISDFLNVSRIKTGKFVIEPKEINLSDMVSEQLVQLREMAEAKELKMVYEPPADFPAVKLDENKMHQVMMNMIDNAIYYTPNEGTITVQLYVDGKDVVFKVKDTGIGVPKAEQHKLFTKFFRAGNARKTRPDGTGLGLFMAQKVVVAQGGSIIFESEEGKGSTFGFRFALKDIKA